MRLIERVVSVKTKYASNDSEIISQALYFTVTVAQSGCAVLEQFDKNRWLWRRSVPDLLGSTAITTHPAHTQPNRLRYQYNALRGLDNKPRII